MESRRNDESLKREISENLFAKADQAEAVLELFAQIRHITAGPLWRDTKVPSAVFQLERSMELHTPSGLRASAVNDTYLGNLAVQGRKV